MKSLVSKLSALAWIAVACASSNQAVEKTPDATANGADAATSADAGVPKSPAPSSAASAAEVPPLPGEEILAARPSLAPLADFAAPVPTLTTLPNGLRIYLVSKPGSSLETLALVVKRGATSDPQRHAGLASLSAAMLEAGAGGKSQAEIAAAADALGAALRSTASTDATLVSISGMPQHLLQMVPLLGDVALRPNLAEAEFKKVQSQRVAELQNELAEPRVAVGRAFAAALYGDSPLGRAALGTPASVQASSLADVKAFIESYSPGESALVAVGGSPADEVLAALTREFGAWKTGAAQKGAQKSVQKSVQNKTDKSHPKAMHEARVGPLPGVSSAAAPSLEALPASQRPGLVFVDFKGRPQTVMRVGLPAVPRSSPDVLALRLLNSVLGGSFTSRLNQNLREQHHYTYGAGSNFAFGRGPGPFAAVSSVKTSETGLALNEMLKEIQRAVSEPLSEDELSKGKALLAYQMVETLEHADGTAAAIAELFIDELPLDELATIVPRLRTLRAQDVLAAGQRAIKTGELTVALAGDEAEVMPQLPAAGLTLPAPEQRDALGEKIAAGAKK